MPTFRSSQVRCPLSAGNEVLIVNLTYIKLLPFSVYGNISYALATPIAPFENCSLLAGMSSQKAPESVVKKIFDMLDTKKDGVLDKEEVCMIICSQKVWHAVFGTLHKIAQFIRKNSE
jgi:hypothetical protein